jgi:hypothetical protein
VYVRGDGEVKYAEMMKLMTELGQAGFSRVTLVTQVGPTSASGQPAGRIPAVQPSAGQGPTSSSGAGAR